MDEDIKYRFDSIDNKISELVDLNRDQMKQLHSHDIKFAEYNSLLEKHIEGVEQNREEIKKTKKEVEKIEVSLDQHKKDSSSKHDSLRKDVEPLIAKNNAWKMLLAIIVSAGTLTGMLLGVLSKIGKL